MNALWTWLDAGKATDIACFILGAFLVFTALRACLREEKGT